MCRHLVNILTWRMRYDWYKQFSIINLSQFFDSVKFRSGSGSRYHLVIDYYEVMFYMLMMLMKFSFVPQIFFRFSFQDQDQDQDFTIEINKQSYALYFKKTHQIWCRSEKFLSKSKSCSRIRIRIMILLWISIPDLHFIHRRNPPNLVWIRKLLRKLLCPQRKPTYVRTVRQTDRQIDRRKSFFACFVF